MRFILANDHLVVQGRTFDGFPLLIADDGCPMEPAQTFLWDLLGKAGRAQSKATWVKYGRAIYDFFAFCQVNAIEWAKEPQSGLQGPVDRYRDWSKSTVGLNPRTVNQRLRVVVWFYEWALKRGHVKALPFEHYQVTSSAGPGFLSHINDTPGTTTTPKVLLAEKKSIIKFLTKEQVGLCLADLANPTHRLMFSLMVRTGLRQVECRTFPEKYLFDPARRKDLAEGQMTRLTLDPMDMKLKGDRPRDIDVPYSLMEDLWWYAVRHRPSRARQSSSQTNALFLNEEGEQYGDQALTDIFARLEARVGFRVRPHMLRHTYGTYTLLSLRKSEFAGEPLLYVRDRLGHASVSTTAVYLHLINQLDAQLILQHEDELDALFASAPTR